MSSSAKQKAHAVCVPYPAQGHINPMLKLANILHSRGFHITFVHTHFNRSRLLRSYGPDSLDGLPSFRFESIPDGLPPNADVDSTQDIPSLCHSTELHCLAPFRDLLCRLNTSQDVSVPPVTCIIADVAMFFTLDAAEELGITELMLWTASTCSFLGYAQFDQLLQRGLVPFKDENELSSNGDLDMVVDWVPGMKGITLRYLPSFLRTADIDDFMLNYVCRFVENSKRASALLFNSFDALDGDFLQPLSSDFPPLYTIGPLKEEPKSTGSSSSSSSSSSLWKEDPRCINWLDSFEPGSVVYVNFGSITVIKNEELVELAWGLANSKVPFMWIIRPDMVTGDSAVLPEELVEETQKRGLIASWCDQEEVLGHPAIGGFLTHCGWNSSLESICNGVPIICCPFFGDQPTNCWVSCKVWGIGMEIGGATVKRSEVERHVRELMEGQRGKEMKTVVMAFKGLAQQAVAPSPHGSSSCNLDYVISKLLLSQIK